jgi:hypothetical protein
LIVWPKIPQKISAQFVCSNPSFGFLKISLSVSVVRGLDAGSFNNNSKHFEHNWNKDFCVVLGVGNQIGDESIKSFLQLHLQAENTMHANLSGSKAYGHVLLPFR